MVSNFCLQDAKLKALLANAAEERFRLFLLTTSSHEIKTKSALIEAFAREGTTEKVIAFVGEQGERREEGKVAGEITWNVIIDRSNPPQVRKFVQSLTNLSCGINPNVAQYLREKTVDPNDSLQLSIRPCLEHVS